jgi:septal ring factor EnvC (AmiA/AmiB activator)
LRFSYIEQVTKEKFLRAITAETPLFIEASDNIALEAQLAEEKTALKKQKEEVASLTKELEKKGRELAKRYQVLQEQKETLQGLPSKLASLQADIEELHSLYPSPHKNENPDLNLPLADTLSLLSERQSSLADVDAEIAALQEELPTKIRELERLDDELSGLSQQKKMAVSRAREARERKEAGGMDEVERRGRWLRTGDSLLRDMMDVDG